MLPVSEKIAADALEGIWQTNKILIQDVYVK
jgi:hypothetical protein